MSYESKFKNEYRNYKVEFIELLDDVEEGCLPVLPDMRVELDEVYAQAAKADEYEAKAKAWEKLNEYVSTSPYDGIDMDTLKNRLNRFINESGESEC